MIKEFQKGTPFFFGPTPLRIFHGTKDKISDYIVASISNDGKPALPDDITIIWESNEVAIITLTGERQEPELIKINVSR